jgi:hypothetical protein
MDETEEIRLHETVSFLGLRAQATAIGLLQLCAELVRAGVLNKDAVDRIKDAIAKDISLQRPRSSSRDEYMAQVRQRLDNLFDGKEKPAAEASD